MSSYIMHMCISDIVKRRLNLTDKFVYGSVLPDIDKTVKGDRNATHFIIKIQDGDDTKNLPDIKKAIETLNITDMDKEVKLGYIAHLLKDYIWFNTYIPSYAVHINKEILKYLRDESLHPTKEFSIDMYKDYSNSNYYVINKCEVNFEDLKERILKFLKTEEEIQAILPYLEYDSNSNIDENMFMTKESIDSYIVQATDEVEKLIKKLLGE